VNGTQTERLPSLSTDTETPLLEIVGIYKFISKLTDTLFAMLYLKNDQEEDKWRRLNTFDTKVSL
jgi:hypothetical protein